MEAKTKKTLWIFAGAFIVLIVVMVVLGGKASKKAAEDWARDSTASAASRDSALKVEAAERARHDSLMANSKPYRDSVKQAEAELAKRIEDEQKRSTPEKFVEVDMNWNKSGFGAVAMGDFTITNNSLRDMKDPVVEVTFYGSSGTELGSKVETLTIVCMAGKKEVVNRVNLGFIKSQVTRAGVKFVSATWGG